MVEDGEVENALLILYCDFEYTLLFRRVLGTYLKCKYFVTWVQNKYKYHKTVLP